MSGARAHLAFAAQDLKPIYDVIIIGAGAAGLMAAIECGKRNRRTLILERSQKPAEKIRISGGGRCNFTNLYTSPSNFLSDNPHFCKSALRRYSQHDFIDLVSSYGIDYHEKTLGQLFCNGSSKQIIDMLLAECRKFGVEVRTGVNISAITKSLGFNLHTNTGPLESQSLVIASGGKSIPKMGATSFGYEIAAQFGLSVVTPEPALVPLTFDDASFAPLKELTGISVAAAVTFQNTRFEEALLFTHRGLSGPAILQISSYWRPGAPLTVDLLPGVRLFEFLRDARDTHPKSMVLAQLATRLPVRLAKCVLAELPLSGQLANIPNRDLRRLGQRVNSWQVLPSGSEGYRTAEVTRGGVNTSDLSSKTMESRQVPSLYFIGEVVDVTGHLGGFNFQWAWSSGHAAGQYA